jgi:hypothetical protein
VPQGERMLASIGPGRALMSGAKLMKPEPIFPRYVETVEA